MASEISKEVFLRDFGRELAERNAVLFVGAGLSRPAGFVDWRELLREIASDLGLDIDLETDLLSVAQFHENQTGNRGKLNQTLLDEFTKGAAPTRNHTLLASLPVESIWTTNYDTLIEDALKAIGRRPNVKHSTRQLGGRVRVADVTVLKMHGDISLPDEAVLTRDDYEEYGRTRQLFSEKL
jgi:NAD-dependent SIR2 family protein deacetylase